MTRHETRGDRAGRTPRRPAASKPKTTRTAEDGARKDGTRKAGPARSDAAKRGAAKPGRSERQSPKRQLPDAAAASVKQDKRQRIAKVMARAGLCSRRDAEGWIVEGRVAVNGHTITSPALDVAATDTVVVDGAPLPQAERTRLFLFHKPRGTITSDRDPENRATVFDYLRERWPDLPRVVTVGRLDINTEGLLLLTNDGGLARLLELPKTGWMRRYRVRAKGSIDQAALDALAGGVTIDAMSYAGIEAKLDRIQGANCWLTMGLREGKNREVKRVLEHLGLEVNRLIRLSFGPFQLLDLPEGAVEEVRTRILRDQLGPSLAAEAGVDLDEPEAAIVVPPAEPTAKRRAERSGRQVSARKPRAPARVSDERRPRRQDRETTEAPPAVRERPKAGPRKHVAALRSLKGKASQKGPRRRVEQVETVDAKRRTVRVERLVSQAPKEQEKRAGRAGRVSPSAAGKRERIARSGAQRASGGDERRPASSKRQGGGPAESGAGRRQGAKPGGRRPAAPKRPKR